MGLVEPSRGLIELYHRAEVLNDAIAELEARGATTVRIDAGSWTADTAIAALAEALSFPDYFGGNLDAFADCMFDVVSRESTHLLAIYQFDSFATAEARLARQLLEILYEGAVTALKVGSAFLVLLQSDDGQLTLPTVGATPITWNRAEFLGSSRT